MASDTLTPTEIHEVDATARWILDLYPPQVAALLLTQLAAYLEVRHGKGQPMDWSPMIAQYRGVLSRRPEGAS